jgi:putative ABC transport system permease protein
MDALGADLRQALRSLLRSPGFTTAALVVLALAIGANTAIFSVVNAVLVKQLPYEKPDGLVWVWNKRLDIARYPFMLPEYLDYKARQTSFEGLAAITGTPANMTGVGEPERLQGARVSGDLFPLLGVRPEAGRLLTAADDDPKSPHAVVLSHGFFMRRFGGDTSALGTTITLNGLPYTLVGVLPQSFLFPIGGPDFAIPLRPEEDPWRDNKASTHFLRILGRLRPGTTLEAAASSLTAVQTALRPEYPKDSMSEKVAISVYPLYDEIVANVKSSLLVLLGAVALVLLVGCANLASLLLARASARENETAIRVALGASSGRIARLFLVESALLAIGGGALGLFLSSGLARLLVKLSPAAVPRIAEAGVDGRVLLFTLGSTVFATLLFGLAPAMRGASRAQMDGLRASRGGASGVRDGRARRFLAVGEVALSLILLVGAGLLVKSLLRLQHVKAGFAPDHVLSVRLSLPPRYETVEKVADYSRRLHAELAALPGVVAAGANHILPLTGGFASIDFSVIGREQADAKRANAQYRIVTPEYFEAMRIPLLAGRVPSWNDSLETPIVCAVGEELARRYFPKGDAVGSRLRTDDTHQGVREITIVGVVGAVKHQGLDQPDTPDVYLSQRQLDPGNLTWMRNNMFWAIRTTGDPARMAEAVKKTIQKVDADVAPSAIQPVEKVVATSLAPRRFNALLLQVFAVAALLLSAAGLYGVLAYGVSRRTREIGVRMALGATRKDVLSLVLGEAMRMTAAGAVIGLLGAAILAHLFRGLLFGVPPSDPATYAFITALLGAVALLAAALPAGRAAGVAPAAALRGE